MRLLLHPDEYRMFIVDQRCDDDVFEKERRYDSSKSTTSNTLAHITDGKIV